MIKDTLKEMAHGLGFSNFGIASASHPTHVEFYKNWLSRGYGAEMEYLAKHLAKKADPSLLLSGAQSIIVVALNYYQKNTNGSDYPKIARYALGRDYHNVVKKKLKRLVRETQKQFPNERFRICVDSAPLFEREFAHLAGLGWFGKNSCLIDSRVGSWFFIGSVITSLKLEPDQPSIGSCGTCTKCIDSCPTGAIVLQDERWQVDSRRCISYLTIEHRGDFNRDQVKRLNGWTFGCDICQEVCPFNTPRESQPLRARETSDPELLTNMILPQLNQIENLTFEAWDELTQGSPIRRAGIEGLKRNVAANIAQAAEAEKKKNL